MNRLIVVGLVIVALALGVGLYFNQSTELYATGAVGPYCGYMERTTDDCSWNSKSCQEMWENYYPMTPANCEFCITISLNVLQG